MSEKRMTMKEFAEFLAEALHQLEKDFDVRETSNGVAYETPNVKAEEVEKLSPEEKLVKFFHEGIFAKNETVVKDLGGGTGEAGGYLIPTDFVAEIIKELDKINPVRRYASVYNIKARTGTIPKEATKPTANWGTENTIATQSEPTFGELAWALNRLDIMSKLSKEFVYDTPINVVNYIRQAFVNAINEAEADAFTNGDGVNKPLGFRNDTGIPTYALATAGSLSYDDMIGMKYAIPQQYRQSPSLVWMASTKAVERIRQIKDNNGRPIFDPERETVLGIPIVENAWIPENLDLDGDTVADETELYLGDFRYYYIFEDMDIEIVSTTEGDAAMTNQIWIAAFKRVDGKVALSTPFVKSSGIK